MDYFAQALSGMLVTVVVFSQVLRGTKFLVHEDPALPSLGYVRLLLKLRASVGRGSLPGVGYLLRSASRMLRRDYNPVDEGSTAQAIAYLAASPAARAYG
jgi:predicted metal-dependent hydrolase